MLYSSTKNFLTYIMAPLLLAACTVSELYTPEINDKMTQVFVSTIPDREGQVLRNKLRFLIEGHGPSTKPQYNLDIKLTNVYTSSVMNTKGQDTRRNNTIYAHVTLKDRKTQEVTYATTVSAVNSFVVQAFQFYATTVTEEYISHQTMDLLAQLIHAEVALHFQKNEN